MLISKKYPLLISSITAVVIIPFFIIFYNGFTAIRDLPDIILVFIVSVIIIISLIYIISYFYFKRVSKEVTDLITLSEKIKEGDRDSLVKVQGKDELSQLGKSLNALAEKISDEFKRLKKLEKVRSEFLGNVSHELKTPIFSIQGYIETLKDGAVNEPEINVDFLDRMDKHAERLNTLVSDLIEISKIESGELKLSYRFFEIQEFIRSVIEELNSLAVANDVTLEYNSSSNQAVSVFADKEKIHQVMINLIENAIKYNKKNGSVTIELKNESKNVIVSVIDTGIGIPEEHHSRIFERFYRVDKTRSREIGGTGLGLAIVKHIIEAHKGNISIESKVDEGSRFSFSLPKQAIS
jgi:two-component system, OmpR family, phosphate regulon sensor histidine kinase PhoR